jgi:hypothetical protein
MSNAKEATASARTLIDNLDKRTDDITIGVNKMTATATRQIEIAGKAITDLAHNPQRILFGGSTATTSATPAPTPTRTAPAPTRRQPQQ